MMTVDNIGLPPVTSRLFAGNAILLPDNGALSGSNGSLTGDSDALPVGRISLSAGDFWQSPA
jgi:hypothetical protein